MKKILLSIFLCVSVMCSTVYAKCLTDSTVTIDVDGSGNWKLNASYNVTNDSGCDATLFVASYFNDEIINIGTYDVNESTVIKDVLVCKISDGTVVTPDAVKVYMWQKGIIKPLTVSECALTEDKLEAANKTFSDNLSDFKIAFNNLKWTEADEDIVAILNKCMDDVMPLNKKHLLTPEFVQRRYSSEITEAKKLYDAMEENERKSLYTKLFDMESELLAFFIDYFGLKIF